MVDTKMHGHLPALLSDVTDYGIWKQTLHDIAIIINVEAALVETSPLPTVTSPHHPTYRRKSAFLRMNVMNSLPADLESTIYMELNVTRDNSLQKSGPTSPTPHRQHT